MPGNLGSPAAPPGEAGGSGRWRVQSGAAGEFIAGMIRRLMTLTGVRHRSIRPDGAVEERLRGELPLSAAGRTAGRGSVCGLSRSRGVGGKVAGVVQPPLPALVAEGRPTGGVRCDAAWGCTPPAGPASDSHPPRHPQLSSGLVQQREAGQLAVSASCCGPTIHTLLFQGSTVKRSLRATHRRDQPRDPDLLPIPY